MARLRLRAERTSTPAATTTWIIDHATTGSIFNNPANTVNRRVNKADL
jgi:hypothetical protein